MVTVSNIATQIANENNYSVGASGDITATNLEYLINNAIDYVNMECGTSIADLSGTAGSKSITATESEIFAVKANTVLMLRAYKDRGPNTALSGFSVTTVIADPQYAFWSDLAKSSLNRLRGRSILRT